MIFGVFTIFDVNRLRRSTPDASVPIAARNFHDIVNVFLLALDLFGGQRGTELCQPTTPKESPR